MTGTRGDVGDARAGVYSWRSQRVAGSRSRVERQLGPDLAGGSGGRARRRTSRAEQSSAERSRVERSALAAGWGRWSIAVRSMGALRCGALSGLGWRSLELAGFPKEGNATGCRGRGRGRHGG